MFHVTLNTSSLHYLLANILSSLSHSNTFLLCWPISCAFIDYRPGAAATVFVVTFYCDLVSKLVKGRAQAEQSYSDMLSSTPLAPPPLRA
jgi:hypothetical protein